MRIFPDFLLAFNNVTVGTKRPVTTGHRVQENISDEGHFAPLRLCVELCLLQKANFPALPAFLPALFDRPVQRLFNLAFFSLRAFASSAPLR